MNIVKDIFGSGFEVYTFLSQKSRVKNTTKRLLIREIRNNIKRLEHRNKNGVNRKFLIDKLENNSIINAIEEGFSFNKLAPKQLVDDKIVFHFKPAKRYIGWDANKLLNSIDGKIVSLKELTELYDENGLESVNLTLRLNNLYIQLILVTVLIKTQVSGNK
jgi:hypothetical protein